MGYPSLETVGLVEFVLEEDCDGEAGGEYVSCEDGGRTDYISTDTSSGGDVGAAPCHEEPHEEGRDGHQGLPADPLDQSGPWTDGNRVVGDPGRPVLSRMEPVLPSRVPVSLMAPVTIAGTYGFVDTPMSLKFVICFM